MYSVIDFSFLIFILENGDWHKAALERGGHSPKAGVPQGADRTERGAASGGQGVEMEVSQKIQDI